MCMYLVWYFSLFKRNKKKNKERKKPGRQSAWRPFKQKQTICKNIQETSSQSHWRKLFLKSLISLQCRHVKKKEKYYFQLLPDSARQAEIWFLNFTGISAANWSNAHKSLCFKKSWWPAGGGTEEAGARPPSSGTTRCFQLSESSEFPLNWRLLL